MRAPDGPARVMYGRVDSTVVACLRVSDEAMCLLWDVWCVMCGCV